MPLTINEFRSSLVSYENTASQIHISRPIVQAGINAALPGVINTYLQRVRDSDYTITAKSYFEPYHSNIKTLLAEHDVSVLSGEDDRFASDQPTIDDALSQQAFYKQRFINEPKRQKSYEKIWHDVVLWHFIAGKRPSTSDSLFSAEWIGVTIDFGLMAFDSHKRKGAGVPLMVHPAALVQALQILIPNDENLEKTILALMQMPFLFDQFDIDDEKVTLKILSTLSRFERIDDMSTESIAGFLGDKALRAQIEKNPGSDRELSLIRDAIAAHAADVEHKAAQSAELFELSKLQSEKAMHQLSAHLAETQLEFSKVKDERDEAHRKIDDVQNLIDSLELKSTKQSQRIKAFFYVTGGILSFICVSFILLYYMNDVIVRTGYIFPFAVALLYLAILCRILQFILDRFAEIHDDKIIRLIRWLGKHVISITLALAVLIGGELIVSYVMPKVELLNGTVAPLPK